MGDYLKEIALKLIKENIDLSNKIQAKERIVEKILDLIKKDLMKLELYSIVLFQKKQFMSREY